MSGLPEAIARPFDRIGRAAGAAILRELADRLEVTAVAIEECRPLDEALERHLTELEQRLIPLLEDSLATRRRRRDRVRPDMTGREGAAE